MTANYLTTSPLHTTEHVILERLSQMSARIITTGRSVMTVSLFSVVLSSAYQAFFLA